MADLVVTPHEEGLEADPRENVFLISPETVQRVRAVPGVAAVDPYRQVRIQVGSTQAYVAARDLALHAERSRYLFVNGDSSHRLRQAIEEQGVVVSEVLAQRLGVNVGDLLSLPTGVGQKDFPVVGVFTIMPRMAERSCWTGRSMNDGGVIPRQRCWRFILSRTRVVNAYEAP